MRSSARQQPAARGAIGGSSALPSAETAAILVEQGAEALAVLRAAWQAGDRPGAGTAPAAAELHAGLLTVVLRLVFLLMLEDRGLCPAAPELCSVRQLFVRLEERHRAAPRGMERRFGAWAQLLTLFRSTYVGYGRAGRRRLGCRGVLFDPRRTRWLYSQGSRGLSRSGPAAALSVDDTQVYRLLRQLLVVRGVAVDYRQLDVELLGSMYEAHLERRARRRSSSHYTPGSWTGSIVARALEPWLVELGPRRSPEQLLGLRICDPAMGGGAFLTEACRTLAAELVEAWRVRGQLAAVERSGGGASLHARRLVARRCLYGVDKDAMAVELGRLSLWLVVGDPELPFDFVDHRLRHGDALVGLSLAQLEALHWRQPPPAADELGALLRARLEQVRRLRLELTEASDADRVGGAASGQLRRRLSSLVEPLVLLGDSIIGAFFEHGAARARQAERDRRLALARRWLTRGTAVPELLREQRQRMQGHSPPFHWPIEFPEAFLEAPPTAPGEAAAAPSGMHVVVGNPPFLGGKRISTEHGDLFAEWLRALHGSTKNTDLAAHFFRRADTLLGPRGTVALIATNTISQGATRKDGLQRLLEDGRYVIYDAVRSRPWGGEAAVSVSVVHLATPQLASAAGIERRLDGGSVAFVNSHLRAMPEHGDAAPLVASQGLCFIGCFLRGAGFILSPAERAELIAKDGHNAACLKPYLGGDEVNSSPRHDFHRYVIDFWDRSLSEAARWPDLLAIVRERVKPARDRLRDHGIDGLHKSRWWQFANTRPELRAALAPLSRCLVAARVTKHLCFAFQPTGRIYSDQLCVFPRDDYAHFAVLQSRVHEIWARLNSSTFGDGLRYTPSGCVETFPVPTAELLRPSGALARIGRRLYVRRARFLRDTGLGLTRTYNLLESPRCSGRRLSELRGLHHALERAVLDAYGWHDLDVVPFVEAAGQGQSETSARHDGEVIERLYALNRARSNAER